MPGRRSSARGQRTLDPDAVDLGGGVERVRGVGAEGRAPARRPLVGPLDEALVPVDPASGRPRRPAPRGRRAARPARPSNALPRRRRQRHHHAHDHAPRPGWRGTRCTARAHRTVRSRLTRHGFERRRTRRARDRTRPERRAPVPDRVPSPAGFVRLRRLHALRSMSAATRPASVVPRPQRRQRAVGAPQPARAGSTAAPAIAAHCLSAGAPARRELALATAGARVSGRRAPRRPCCRRRRRAPGR